jgi:hypothetical protein
MREELKRVYMLEYERRVHSLAFEYLMFIRNQIIKRCIYRD